MKSPGVAAIDKKNVPTCLRAYAVGPKNCSKPITPSLITNQPSNQPSRPKNLVCLLHVPWIYLPALLRGPTFDQVLWQESGHQFVSGSRCCTCPWSQMSYEVRGVRGGSWWKSWRPHGRGRSWSTHTYYILTKVYVPLSWPVCTGICVYVCVYIYMYTL